MMVIAVKKSEVWYRKQDFSCMNDESRDELESLFTEDDEYNTIASVEISLHIMMRGDARQDKRI